MTGSLAPYTLELPPGELIGIRAVQFRMLPGATGLQHGVFVDQPLELAGADA